MKAIFTTLCIMLAISLMATIHTVDNKETSGADFTDLQAAIDAATAGDTIYVSGSPVSYGSITINKRLILFGQGYKPNNQFGSPTEVGAVTYDFVVFPSSDPSGSHFEGFITSAVYIGDTDFRINNITLTRNWMKSTVNLVHGVFDIIIENNILRNRVDFGGKNCIIEGVGNNTLPCSTNIIFRNNITYSSGTISNSYSNTILVTNNVFISTSTTVPSIVSGAIFSNNIFYGSGIGSTTSDCDFCTFTNNISFGPNETDFDYATNTTGNNLEATDPMFEDAPLDFNLDQTNLLHDFRLKVGSPGIGAGSDGTEIGIFGGPTPFPITETDEGFEISPLPTVPQVTEMNILNSSIPEDGTLNVEFKAKKVN